MPDISLFKNIAEPKNPETISLLKLLEDIRDGRWEDIVTQCRLIKDKEERDAFKQTIPTATISGRFSYRNDASLLSHSEYIAIDLDDIEDINSLRQKLSGDRYVYSCFMSVGGRGLRVIFRVEPNKHREAFRSISKYIYDNYNEIVADPNGVNVSKPYVVSFDPHLYLSFDDVPIFKKYVKETPVKKVDYVHTAGDFEEIVKQIVNKGTNICEEYQDWLKLGFAISSQFGENGRYYFHELSRMSHKYSQRITDKQYTYCLRGKGDNKINISSFYYLARENGIKIISDQTKKILRATKTGKRAGLNKDQIIKNLEKFDEIVGADELVNNIFEADIEDTNEDSSTLPLLEIFISNNYNLVMNEVTGYLEQGGKELTPNDLNSIFISAKKIIPNLDYPLLIRLLKSDFIPAYNPFFKFFGSDGVAVEQPAIPAEDEKQYSSPLINRLASSIENDNPGYTVFFLRKWVVSIISAAHKVHSPLLLALIGPQNSGKTEFFRRLLPRELSAYYGESKLDKGKDDELLMCEKLILVDDELGGKTRQDAMKLKNITSVQYYYIRRPYGDHNERILRLAVLGGTSNHNEIMNDRTGNRRILPIEVRNINKDLYNSINKKELFMEAFRLYKEGFDWRVTHKDIEFLNKHDYKYQVVIKEGEMLQKYFLVPSSDSTATVHLTTTEIMIELERLTNMRVNLTELSRDLEQHGFQKKSNRDDNGVIRKRWAVVRINRMPDDPYYNTTPIVNTYRSIE